MDQEPPFRETYKTLLHNSSLGESKEENLFMAEECDLPLIDLSQLSVEREKCIKQIAQAAREWGFFQVVNHGVSQEVLKILKDEQMKLFHLPFQKKIEDNFLNLPANSYRWGNSKATSLRQVPWSEALHLSLADISRMDECKSTLSFSLYLFTKEAKGENKERKEHQATEKSISLGLLAKAYAVMLVSEQATMAINSYQSQAGSLLKEYVLADPFIPYTSIIGGILACKMVYDLSQVISANYFKGYATLSRIQRIEWNNRALSTIHAIFITIISLNFVFWSDLYSDNQFDGLITLRSSLLSTFVLGVSVGYFLVDLGMIFWCYPALGGFEFVIHHLLSIVAVAYSMLTGEGQLYTYMVLISETTTPGINLRWYLDTIGMKRSKAYLINGVAMFFAWLVARIILFVYLFYHVYLHYDQIKQLHSFGFFLVSVVPLLLTVMNLMWFWKLFKGLKKILAKRH